MKDESANVMVLTTFEVRRQLKIIAAVSRTSMKEVLARLVAAEFKRVMPNAPGGKS
jgi:hypothetical protein